MRTKTITQPRRQFVSTRRQFNAKEAANRAAAGMPGQKNQQPPPGAS